MGKKKRPNVIVMPVPNIITLDNDAPGISEGELSSQGPDNQQAEIATERTFCFKNSKWVSVSGRFAQTGSASGSSSKRSKSWKPLKQIISSERNQLFESQGCVATLYGSLEAGPSTRHAKKYSDISGLISKYTDPETKLRYSNAKEFRKIRLLSPDLVQGYLSLRRANVIV